MADLTSEQIDEQIRQLSAQKDAMENEVLSQRLYDYFQPKTKEEILQTISELMTRYPVLKLDIKQCLDDMAKEAV